MYYILLRISLTLCAIQLFFASMYLYYPDYVAKA